MVSDITGTVTAFRTLDVLPPGGKTLEFSRILRVLIYLLYFGTLRKTIYGERCVLCL